MAEKTLQQQAYDVGYGRVTSRQKARATNAIVNAANGMAGLAYDISKTVIGFQEEAEKAKQAEEDSYNSDADIYYDTIINSINQGSDNFESQGVNTNVYQSNMNDLVDTVLDEQWIVDNIGGSNDHASRFLTEYGDEIRMRANGLVTTTTTKIQGNLVVANDINKRNSLIGLAGSPEEALAGAQENYTRNNVGMYDLAGNRDPSKPGVQAEIGYQWTISHINEEAEKAIHMESENDFKSRMRNSYTSFTDGKYSEDDIETANAVRIYADSVDEEAGRAYQTARENAISSAESKATAYNRLEYEFKRQNGGTAPSMEQVYSMLAEAGFNTDNSYDMEVATRICKGYGFSEAVMMNPKVMAAVSSKSTSAFYDSNYQGYGVYIDGVKVGSDESIPDIDLTLLTSHEVRTTNLQPYIDMLAEQNGIQPNTASYQLLAESIMDWETANASTISSYYENALEQAYYSDMADDNFISYASTLKLSGAINGELYSKYMNKMNERNTIYTPYRENAENMINDYLNSITSDSKIKSLVKSYLIDAPGARERLEAIIRSKSGSDLNNLRYLTKEEIKQIVDEAYILLSNEEAMDDLVSLLSGALDEAGSDRKLTMVDTLLKDEDAFTMYNKYLDGDYDAYIVNDAIEESRVYLDDRENWGNGLNKKELLNTVSKSIYGKNYDELEEAGFKNIVELNANISMMQSFRINDLYKFLYGTGNKTEEDLDPKYAIYRTPEGENLEVKEVNITGIGNGFMTSTGDVYAIDPSSFGTGQERVIAFYFPTSSQEYKDVMSGNNTEIYIDAGRPSNTFIMPMKKDFPWGANRLNFEDNRGFLDYDVYQMKYLREKTLKWL